MANVAFLSLNTRKMGDTLIICVFKLGIRISIYSYKCMKVVGKGFIQHQSKIGQKDYWSWYVSHSSLFDLLNEILPFLVEKREEAELAMKFHAEYPIHKFKSASEEELRGKREYYLRMKEIHHMKGVGSEIESR